MRHTGRTWKAGCCHKVNIMCFITVYWSQSHFVFSFFTAKVKAKTYGESERADNLGTVGVWRSVGRLLRQYNQLTSQRVHSKLVGTYKRKGQCVETKFQNQADNKSSQFNHHERLFPLPLLWFISLLSPEYRLKCKQPIRGESRADLLILVMSLNPNLLTRTSICTLWCLLFLRHLHPFFRQGSTRAGTRL